MSLGRAKLAALRLRTRVHWQGMRATAFRMGAYVGETGFDASSPYEPDSRSDRMFAEGVKWGKLTREKSAAHDADTKHRKGKNR